VLSGDYAKRVTFYIAPDGTLAAVDDKVKVVTAAEDALARLAVLQQTGTRDPLGGTTPVTTVPSNKRFAGPADTRVTMDSFVADFGLPDVQTGKTRALSTLRAGKKATVIVFVSTASPVSNAYENRLARLAAVYQPRGVAFLGINANATETAAQAGAHVRARSTPFPVVKDEGAIATRFQATRTPEVFVLDENGVLAYHGAVDDSQTENGVKTRYVQAALDALLAGRPVPTKTTVPVGSAITRRAAR
jgi:peroxiredoxin